MTHPSTIKTAIRPYRDRIVSSIIVFTVFVSATPALAIDGPFLDIKVSSDLQTDEKHKVGFLDAMHNQVLIAARRAFPLEHISRKLLADGEAPFRVEVDHRVKISFAKAPVAESSYKLLDTKTEFNARGDKITTRTYDKNQYDTSWYLTVSEKSTVELRLLQWTGSQYRKIKTWKHAIQLRSEDGEADGPVEVATLSQNATNAPIALKPKCPIGLSEAKTIAIASLRAGNLDCKERFNDFVLVRMGRVKRAADGSFHVELTVQNKSPWQLTSLTVNVNSTLVNATAQLTKPIDPGKRAKVEGTGSRGFAPRGTRTSLKLTRLEFKFASK